MAREKKTTETQTTIRKKNVITRSFLKMDAQDNINNVPLPPAFNVVKKELKKKKKLTTGGGGKTLPFPLKAPRHLTKQVKKQIKSGLEISDNQATPKKVKKEKKTQIKSGLETSVTEPTEEKKSGPIRARQLVFGKNGHPASLLPVQEFLDKKSFMKAQRDTAKEFMTRHKFDASKLADLKSEQFRDHYYSKPGVTPHPIYWIKE